MRCVWTLAIVLLLTGCATARFKVSGQNDPQSTNSLPTGSITVSPSSIADAPTNSPEPTPSNPLVIELADDNPQACEKFTLPQSDEEIDELLSNIFLYRDFIDLAELDAGFIFDITYATENNFLGTVLYDTPLCLAHVDLARLLLKAQASFVEQGYRLIIYDIYRPMSIQQTMYDLTPPDKKSYVAKPGPTANHPKGIAVDCSLADSDGIPLPMPSGYDEFSDRTSTAYTGGTAEELANRDLLIDVFSALGLKVASGEWWHFALHASDYNGMDITFKEFTEARGD